MSEDNEKYIVEKINNVDSKIDSVASKIAIMFDKYDKLKEDSIRYDEKLKVLWKLFFLTPGAAIVLYCINSFLLKIRP